MAVNKKTPVKKKKTASVKNKNKKSIMPGIILVISALLLGSLIIILVYQTRKIIEISGSGDPANRKMEGSYPLPSELITSDLNTYFGYTDIPDFIFTKMQGVSFTEDCPVAREDLRYMTVLYWGTDNAAHKGELIVNKSIAPEVSEIFYQLYKASYPIESIKLVDEYGGNDEVSMANNNTSCFNARKVKGSDTWSMHAYGLAIDINPLYNPYVGADGSVLPVMSERYANRDDRFIMKIDADDYAYNLFAEHGFTWGGSWEKVKDYQHFEKQQ